MFVWFLGVGPLGMANGAVARVWAETCSDFVGTNGKTSTKFSDDFEMKVVVMFCWWEVLRAGVEVN